MTRFLLTLIRNCGVAIAISIFFAAARGPSHPPRTDGIDASAAIEAGRPAAAPTLTASGCDQPAIRVCRMVDAGQRLPEMTR